MRAIDILTNLKNWSSWDYKSYKLNEPEAKPCKDALDNYIWHSIIAEGNPPIDKNSSYYICRLQDDLLPEAVIYLVYYYDQMGQFVPLSGEKNARDMFSSFRITHWRKIIDNTNAYYEDERYLYEK